MPASLPIAHIVLVFLGAGCGGVARVLLTLWIDQVQAGRWLPFTMGTLVVNVVGSLLIGVIAGFWGEVTWVRPLVLMGLLGGFTTFSSFSAQVFDLMAAGRLGAAALLVGVSVGLGVAAAGLGLFIGRSLG